MRYQSNNSSRYYAQDPEMLSTRWCWRNPYQAPPVDMVANNPTESSEDQTLAPSTSDTHQGVRSLLWLRQWFSYRLCERRFQQKTGMLRMLRPFVGLGRLGPWTRSAKQETAQGLDRWREDLRVVKMPGQKYTSGIDSCHQWWLGLQVYSFMRAFCKSRTPGSQGEFVGFEYLRKAKIIWKQMFKNRSPTVASQQAIRLL